MSDAKKLIILGTGWLGSEAARYFDAAGWQVEAARRTQMTAPGYMRVFHLDNGEPQHNLTLENAYWLCCIPPGSRQPESNYQETLAAALALYKDMQGKGFVLCSSTGIYPQAPGIYNETASLQSLGERQRRLLDAEEAVAKAGGKIVRLAGLIGPGREPGQFVAGKQLSSHPDEPVNLIRREDIIAALDCLFANWAKADQVYNLVYPAHPGKAEYYGAACACAGNPAPQFSGEHKVERLIDGSAIESLGFRYRHPI